MTWVLAKPFIQDYSLIISDVCVTYHDSESGKLEYQDCLLKIHDISKENGLMLGFAGNITNAFAIIDDMRNLSDRMAAKSSNGKFDILDFILSWRKYTQDTGKHQYENNNENGVYMLIAGNHTANNSTGNQYAPCGAYKIEAPEYRPMSIHPFHWTHIGSGSGMQVCKDIIDQLSNDFILRVAVIDVPPERIVELIAPRISKVLEDGLIEAGVSSRLVIGISTIGDTGLAATYREEDGTTNPIPSLASSLKELQDQFDGSNAKAKFYATSFITTD
jgi:hypothetical protein